MIRNLYPYADKLTPKTWQRKPLEVQTNVDGGKTWDGEYIIYFMCSNGHIGNLNDHQINAKGEVRPSVWCPEKDCDFHENITLDGYGGC